MRETNIFSNNRHDIIITLNNVYYVAYYVDTEVCENSQAAHQKGEKYKDCDVHHS
jgi:hypothetical protein